MAEDIRVITVISKQAQPIKLHFRDPKRAQAAWNALVAPDRGENDFELVEEDDYGCKVMVNRDEVAFITLEDPRTIVEAQIEIAMIQARANAKAQKLAQSDAALRIMTPTGPGFHV